MLWNFLCTFQRCTFLQCAAPHPIIVLSLKCHPCSVKGPCQCVWWALQMSDRRLSGKKKKTWYREMPFVSKWRRWQFLDSTDQLNKCLVLPERQEENARRLGSVPASLPSCSPLCIVSIKWLLNSSLDHTTADRLMPPPNIYVSDHSNIPLHNSKAKRESDAMKWADSEHKMN